MPSNANHGVGGPFAMSIETNDSTEPRRSYKTTFNVKAILAALGDTPIEVREALIAARVATDKRAPSDSAIYQWRSRGRIALRWLPSVLYTATVLHGLKFADAFIVRRH
jgi:hypothetical protein